MGPEISNGWEFKSGGTLYFSPLTGDCGIVGSLDQINEFRMSDEAKEAVEVEPVPIYVNKIVREPVEITGTCRIKFRGLVMLLGFWPAVKWTVRGWWSKFKSLWRK